MNTEIMISIRPDLCNEVIYREKMAVLRKNKPKSNQPFRCFIYRSGEYIPKWVLSPFSGKYMPGKVIGEFICNRVSSVFVDNRGDVMSDFELGEAGFSVGDIQQYGGLKKIVFAWHISDLVVYKNPKSLSQFIKPDPCDFKEIEDNGELCNYCIRTDFGDKAFISTPNGPIMCEGLFCKDAYLKYLEDGFSLAGPPKSWCYVKEKSI